jgi:hypothetical protein
MTKVRFKRRCSISLGALLTAWGLAVLWFCWIEVVGDALRDFREYQHERRQAMSQPLVRP